MAILREDQMNVAETRKEPISDELKTVLLRAAEDAGVDFVRVISGGQPSSGPNRVGSTRHDNGNAADLELLKGEHTLDFTKPAETPIFESFVRAAAAAGATGMGAGVGYMGSTRIHVGFGKQAVWDENNSGANAPKWLREAAMQGWTNPVPVSPPSPDIQEVAADGSFSLSDLQATIQEQELVLGLLVGIKSEGSDTILSFDESRAAPVTPIELEQEDVGEFSVRDGMDEWVTSGVAIVSGRSLPVSAYRAAFRGQASVSTAVPPEGRALLDTIAGTESPGYDVIYGGQRFTDFSRHPNIAVPIRKGPNAGKTSSAAGRYQFLFSTWTGLQTELGLPDFSAESQDRAAWHLAQKVYQRNEGRDLLDDLRNGKYDLVGPALHSTWTSLPGGIEQGVNRDRFVRNYAANLAKYIPPTGPTTAVA